MKPTLQEAWKAYVEKLRQKYGHSVMDVEDPDMNHLDSIGACDELKSAARYLPGIEYINWAPSEELREFAPALFPHSLIIGDDGCGNYMCWMDVRNKNSKILYISHDPPMIMVIANTAVEWLEGLIEALNNLPINEKEESDWGVFYESSGLEKAERKIWQEKFFNGSADELGLKTWQDGNLHYFDFGNASPGAGVSLEFNGRHTTVITGNDAGVIALGTLSNDQIKSQRRADYQSYALMLICFIGNFYYFNQVVGKKEVASFFSAGATTVVAIIVLGLLYNGLDTAKDWLKSSKKN